MMRLLKPTKKIKKKKPYTSKEDLQCDDRENSIYNISRYGEYLELFVAAEKKIKEKKKKWSKRVICAKIEDEIQKNKKNRPYVKRYLELGSYSIVVIKNDNIDKVPMQYLKDWIKFLSKEPEEKNM